MKDRLYPHQRDKATEVADLLCPHLEDILGRGPIGQPSENQRHQLAGSRVLITGAAGSIGWALSQWLSQIQPEMLALLDNHEDSLFKLKQSLNQSSSSSRTKFIIADVRAQRRMEWVLGEVKPDIIFHLAAYKHVPMAEEWPGEFVQTNIVGTWQLSQAASRHGVKKLVYASTDKAVNPPSVYGTTKRVVEVLLRCLSREADHAGFTVVRLVNVVGARGSVIETFARDIMNGNKVRITDPKMTRYWITFPDALYLLISAACRPSSGDILLPDAGEAVAVTDMARRIWRLLRSSETDPTIEFTGIRPGERLEEQLAYPAERLVPSGLPGILEVVRDSSSPEPSLEALTEEVAILRRMAEEAPPSQLRERLFKMVRAHS